MERNGGVIFTREGIYTAPVYHMIQGEKKSDFMIVLAYREEVLGKVEKDAHMYAYCTTRQRTLGRNTAKTTPFAIIRVIVSLRARSAINAAPTE